MQKRIKRQAVCEESHIGRWIAAAVIIGGFILAGWWLFGGQSKSKAREIGLQKISVMVDRIDELSSAWKGRSVPQAKNPDKGGNDSKAQSKPHNDVKPEATPPAGSVPATDVKTPPPLPPEPEVSPEDQEQLRKLLREINKP
ncbi:MAG TPA: hypothetical protein VM658_05735 [bacterium]|nr:hypothetical protein [bacterium]